MAKSLDVPVFSAIKTVTSLKEKFCLKFLSCCINVIGHIFKNLCKESFKLTRIKGGKLLKQWGRKELKNSTEKAEKWNLGVNMEATWGSGELQ